MSYNGWTNYETWRVKLEWFDDERSILERYSEKPDPYDLAQDLEEDVESTLEGMGSGITLDYALAFVSDVNWREIAENMLEGWEEEEDEEEDEEDEEDEE